jgi:putative ABC transport system permease protein
LLGAVLAVLLAVWGVDLMRAAIPQEIYRVRPGLKYLEVDGGVLGFTLIIALLAGVMLGLVPALQASGRKAFSALNDALKEGGRTSSAGSAGGRARGLLVISEVALALVLLVGAGLMVKAFRHMSTVDAGFNPRNLLTMRLALPEAKYRQANQAAAFYDQVLQQLAALPQVRATATAGNLGIAEGFLIEGRPEPEPGEPRPAVQPVSADYFRAMGIPVLKGRPISEHDTAEAPLAAVLSESVIRHYWPRVRDPIGARVRVGGPQSPWFSVVGVVGDVKDWFSGQPQPAIYLSHLQRPQHSMKLLIRTSGDPLRVVSGARAQVRSLDADQPVYDVESMEQYLAGQTSGVRISATMIAVFAAMALVLAAAGIYAVISYSAAQRTHEIGVRMALGATRGDVLKLVVGHALKLALAGLALGLPAAYALTHAMSSALFGVIALDAATFAAFTLLLAATALLAGYFPARRATRVAPIVALRYE